jgi:hypothetical protein
VRLQRILDFKKWLNHSHDAEHIALIESALATERATKSIQDGSDN